MFSSTASVTFADHELGQHRALVSGMDLLAYNIMDVCRSMRNEHLNNSLKFLFSCKTLLLQNTHTLWITTISDKKTKICCSAL